MGGMMGMMDKLPGMSQLPDNVKDKVDDKMFKQMEDDHQLNDNEERQRPDLIKGSRKKRIAAGSGTQVQDVNRMLKQFTQMQKMMEENAEGWNERHDAQHAGHDGRRWRYGRNGWWFNPFGR